MFQLHYNIYAHSTIALQIELIMALYGVRVSVSQLHTLTQRYSEYPLGSIPDYEISILHLLSVLDGADCIPSPPPLVHGLAQSTTPCTM